MSGYQVKAIIDHLHAAGKYELRHENKEGMNAYSFVAKHLHLNRDVFLKVYDAVPDEGDIFLEPRFLVEATSSAGGNPHLIEVLDAEMINDDFVLVAMELVDGGSLLNSLKQGPFNLMDAISITKGILQGVSHLHASRFLHRDIKPANVILTKVNGRFHPKIGDFGSMVKLSPGQLSAVASRHSALYVPPEAWSEPSEYDFQSDIYQVGIVLYEMINGPMPYCEESYLDRQSKTLIKKFNCSCFSEVERPDQCSIVNDAICRRARSNKLLSLVEPRPYLYGNIKRIINKATHPERGLRYKTAVEMYNAILSINVPDWGTDGNSYLARNWRGWDWKIEEALR
ncbi:serine/threonine protein kinase [Megalodesulfovibrio gigas]|uniref:serine/threonine protein kinase n=1 Tax=Megalodesulfovibrio gigas TaxID=879 RepID=UPI0009DBC7F6|nr:serine/threonine-protein kinase [Megalodesulfovibrio gigas]